MKNRVKFTAIIAIFGVLALSGCKKEDEKAEIFDYKVKVELPDVMNGVDPTGLTVTLKNINTGTTTTANTDGEGVATLSIVAGVYKIDLSGEKEYPFTNSSGESQSVTAKLSGLIENIAIQTANTDPEIITAIISTGSKGWIIKEIYFTASKTPAGGSYFKDQFIELYNNSNEVLYAGGISIAEAAHNTVTEPNIYASDINQNSYVRTVYTIPGSSSDVPVQPGKSILIAPQPIDHTIEANINSFDLSGADYQWYDNVSGLTIDVPSVPNLDKHYSYSASVWMLHTRGYYSYLIFRAPIATADFVTQNTDIRNNNAGKSTTAIKVANEYILDAVELSNPTQFTAKALSVGLDAGFTYCDGAGIAKSVRRKVEKVDNGRVVYQDTNNSIVDFIPNSTPKPKQFPLN